MKVEALRRDQWYPATVTSLLSTSGVFEIFHSDGERESGVSRERLRLISPLPLHVAAAALDIDLCRLLVEKKADVNVQNKVDSIERRAVLLFD